MSWLIRAALVGVAALLATSTVFAQPGELFKLPPLHDSDTFVATAFLHSGITAPNWAGQIMKAHVLDASEVDVDAIVPLLGGPGGAPETDPFGPRSANVQSEPRYFTAWHPLAQQSGITLQPSSTLPVFNLNLHVKGSSSEGNSDADMSLMFWNIFHLRHVLESSGLLQLEISDLIWVTSNIEDVQQLHITDGPNSSQYLFPSNPAQAGDPLGHWLHILEPVTFHLLAGSGSQFYATMGNTILVGIEHVPEPASAILLGLGGVCGLVTIVLRRRRLAAG